MAERARFDYGAFAREMRLACRRDGRGLRAIASDVGVTATDLSRAQNGNLPLSFEKVQALADWIGVEPRRWYSGGISKINVLQCGSRGTSEVARP